MKAKSHTLATYLTLDQGHWLATATNLVGLASGTKIKIRDRWRIVIQQWIEDGKPGVALLDECGAASYATYVYLDTPQWEELVKTTCDLSISRGMIVGVAVLVRSILDHYMKKETADAFASRCRPACIPRQRRIEKASV